MTTVKDWFAVDRRGLRKLMERRGRQFVLFELLSNAWDQHVTTVSMTATFERGTAQISVTDDDPEGFLDLSHAFTLFAESGKLCDPEKRGRFNLGEKLVIAVMDWARVVTTTGGFQFDAMGRHPVREKTEKGSVFTGGMRMKREEFDAMLDAVRRVLPPAGIVTTLNGEVIQGRAPLERITATLPTEFQDVVDGETIIKRTERQTVVEVVETRNGEAPFIYEMGVPVVELEAGDRWNLNVLQRVPLNMERENVTPAFLRRLRVAVLNSMHRELPKEDAAAPWVQDATSSPDCAPEAMTAVLDKRFGEKRVAFDPSDPEANKRAVAAGYTVISGGTLNKDQWANARATELRPAGQVTPGRRLETSPDGVDCTIPEADWTPEAREVAAFAEDLALDLIGAIHVRLENLPIGYAIGAHYGGRVLTFNVRRLGWDWFYRETSDLDNPGARLLALLLHEFAHQREADHLSDAYNDELCRLGAALAKMAARGKVTWKGKVWVGR